MFEVKIECDIAYGPHDRHLLDLYLPQGGERFPLVVYVHGGGWTQGDKSSDAEKRLLPVARMGVAVAAVNYRLAPEVAYPEPIRDIKAALAWLKANADTRGFASDGFCIWGASAGGYIASMTALTPGDPLLAPDTGNEDIRVAAAVIWFAPSDIASSSRRSWLEKLVMAPPHETMLLNVEDPASDARAQEASPLLRAGSDAPPFLIAHGDRDIMVPVRESEQFHQALVRSGTDSTLMIIGGSGHEGEEFDSPAILAMTAAFLKQHAAAAIPG